MKKNKHAQALVKLARGVPKRYSAEEIAKRTERLKGAREVKKLQFEIALAEAAFKAVKNGRTP